MSPHVVALGAMLVILVAYGSTGIMNSVSLRSYESYFLADRQVSSSHVSATFAAGGISVGTVLLFFLVLGTPFGWQVLWAPVTFIIGYYLFIKYILSHLSDLNYIGLGEPGEKSFEENVSPDINIFAPSGTLGEIIRIRYDSKLVSTIVLSSAFLGMLCIIVSETYISVELFRPFFLEPELSLFLVAAVLFAYAGFGGLRAVLVTDRWQLWLISLALLALLGVVSFAWLGYDTAQSATQTENGNNPGSARVTMPVAIWLNMLVVNVCYTPALLRTWQVLAASKDANVARRGLMVSLGYIVVISLVAIAIGTLYFQSMHPELKPELAAIFEFLVTTNSFTGYVVYPLLVVGLFAALLSTVDSALLPIV